MKPFLKYHIKDKLKLAYQDFKLSNLDRGEPILIFTMAKVGSLSVYSSIKKHSNFSTFHIHSLDENEVKEGDEVCFKNGIYPDSHSPVPLINRKIINNQQPYKIISLFRNPVDRNLSAFFDAFKLYTGVMPMNYKGSMSMLKDIYFQKLPHLYPINWFSKQFFSGTGINIYDHAFDKEKKYSIYQYENVELLMMDCYLEDKEKERLISEFTKINNFSISNTNVTSESKSADLYKNFKNEVRFDKGYLDSLLDTPYVKHFFNEEDKEKTYNKWLKK